MRKLGGVVAVVIALGGTAHAYGVGPADPLETLGKKAELICKATAVADKQVTDPWFEELTGFATHETELKTISCLKGAPPKSFKFRHYANDPKPAMGYGYSPLHYELVVGRTYVLFASNHKPGIYRQIRKDHTMKPDQGLLVAADVTPLKGTTLTDAIRAELTKLLASSVAADATYGIIQLDLMSGGRLSDLKDFDRQSVLAEVKPLLAHKDVDIASTAIDMFGGDSPYYIDDDAPYWLAAKGPIGGLSPRTPPAIPTADAARAELLAVATTYPVPKVKALAIRALGRSKLTASELRRWAFDADVEIRRAVILISAESTDHSLIVKASTDPIPAIRRSAALAAGFSRDPKLLPQLERLSDDADAKVSAAGAMAILAFGDAAAKTMVAKLSSQWGPLFLNVLARKNPQPYLAKLGEVIEKQLRPANWWGGSIPAGESWKILFDYVKARTTAELATLDTSLDSLEKMKWFSSGEPRDLYAFYVRRGLTARAKKFRTALKTAVSYSMDQYLDEADKHPERFVP